MDDEAPPNLKTFLDTSIDWLAFRRGGVVAGGAYPGPPPLSAGRGEDPSVRKRQLGMADTDHYLELSFLGEFFGPKWAPYWMHAEACQTAPQSFEIWRAVIFHDSTDASLEVIDRPVRRLAIHVPGHEVDLAAIGLLLRGRALIGRAARPGRPPGLSALGGLDDIRAAIPGDLADRDLSIRRLVG